MRKHLLTGEVRRNGKVIYEFDNLIFPIERLRVLFGIINGEAAGGYTRVYVDNCNYEGKFVNINFTRHRVSDTDFGVDLVPTRDALSLSHSSSFTYGVDPGDPIAHPISRICIVYSDGDPNDGTFASADFVTKSFGRVNLHNAGSEYLGNENVNNFPDLFVDGEFNENGHFFFVVLITNSGNSGSARYCIQRWPYYRGAYFPGSASGDSFDNGESFNNLLRSNNARCHELLQNKFPDLNNPLPAQVPYDSGFFDNLNPVVPSSIFDRDHHVFITCTRGNSFNSNANGIWAFCKMTGDTLSRLQISGLPSTSVEYREIAKGRGGWAYLATDSSTDDNSTVGPGGYLAITNPFTFTATVLLSNLDCLAVSVDTSEAYTSSGIDRVWVLTRSGLRYVDIDINNGIQVGSTITIGGATLGDSARGLGGYIVPNFGDRNVNKGLMSILNGRVYWISRTTPGSDNSNHRLNRIDGDGNNFSFYTANPNGEFGAIGVVGIGRIGSNNNPRHVLSFLRVFQPDPGDPNPGEIWITGPARNNAIAARRILETEWGTQDPGTPFFRDNNPIRNENHNIQITPDGTVWLISNQSRFAVLRNGSNVFEGTDNSQISTGDVRRCGGDWYADGSGQALIFAGSNTSQYAYNYCIPVTYQYNEISGQWYRRRFEDISSASGRIIDAQTHSLPGSNGNITFDVNGPVQDLWFVDERYTFFASRQLIKDPDEKISVSCKFYITKFTTRSEIITPSAGIAQANMINGTFTGDSVNPLTQGTADERRFKAQHRRDTSSSTFLGGDVAAAIDVGSDQTASIVYGQFTINETEFRSANLELWSASSSDGITNATLRATFNPNVSNSAWSFQLGANGTSSGDQDPLLIKVNIDQLIISEGLVNSPQRYWKIIIRNTSSTKTMSMMSVIDANGNALGGNPKLSAINDTNVMAVDGKRLLIEVVSGTGATIDDKIITIPNTSGIQVGDVIIINDEESIITNVINGTQLEIPNRVISQGVGQDFFIGRRTNISTDDNPLSSEVYIDNLTGTLVFSPIDISNNTVFHIKYAAIERSF